MTSGVAQADIGACPPIMTGIFFQSITVLRTARILSRSLTVSHCAVEYSTCVSGFRGFAPRHHPGFAPGPQWD